MRPFFDSMVRGTKEPELERLLEGVGWQLSPAPNSNAAITSMGVSFVPGSTKIKTIRRGSCAEHAGLAAGDVLLALNDLQVKADKPALALLPYTAGDEIKVHAFRRDVMKHFTVTLEKRPTSKWKISPATHADDKANNKRSNWLHSR